MKTLLTNTLFLCPPKGVMYVKKQAQFPLIIFSHYHQIVLNTITRINHRSNKPQPCHTISPLQMKTPSYGNLRHKLPSPVPLESPSHSPPPSQNCHRTSKQNSSLALMRFLCRLPATQSLPHSHCHTAHKHFCDTDHRGQSGRRHHRTKEGYFGCSWGGY